MKLRSKTSTAITARRISCSISRSKSATARWWRCSAATAPASRRRSVPSSAWSSSAPAASCSRAGTSPREPTHAIVRGGLGYVPEERRIFTDLTVEENLEVGRQPKRPNAPHWTREKLFTLFPNLGEMRGRPGGRMSGGEQQMLTIARTLMGNPSLVLLDEPSEGLSPKIVEQMVEAILAMKKEGVSIVVSEQNLHFARLISDRAYIIERGKICYGGTMAELDARPDIRDAHLSL